MTCFRRAALACAAVLGFAGQGGAADPDSCPTTVAPLHPFAEPSRSSASRFWFGSEALAVLLNRSGAWRGMGPRYDYRDKLFWRRQGYNGATEQRPELLVSGRRLDGEPGSPKVSKATNAHHESFGGWAMLVGVEFPSSGCWEVKGEYKGQALSFVVRVGS